MGPADRKEANVKTSQPQCELAEHDDVDDDEHEDEAIQLAARETLTQIDLIYIAMPPPPPLLLPRQATESRAKPTGERPAGRLPGSR